MASEGTTLSIDEVVEDVRLDTRISQKSGKPYKMLVVRLTNGLEIDNLPERAAASVIELLMASK